MEYAMTADGRGAISMADSTKHRIESNTFYDQGRGQRTMFGSFGGGPGQVDHAHLTTHPTVSISDSEQET